MAEEITSRPVQRTDTPPHAQDQLSPDVIKLCALLAHILMRRLSTKKGANHVSPP
jgi:hypothetical protein